MHAAQCRPHSLTAQFWVEFFFRFHISVGEDDNQVEHATTMREIAASQLNRWLALDVITALPFEVLLTCCQTSQPVQVNATTNTHASARVTAVYSHPCVFAGV